MPREYDNVKMGNVVEYDEDTHLRIIEAFLIHSKSHRQIQREILGLPAPAHGGGFVAMNILHYYGVSGEDKGLMKDKSIDWAMSSATPRLKEALNKLSEKDEIEHEVKKQIDVGSFEFKDKPTQISRTTKVRIYQNVLRRIVLGNYKNKCAICNISKTDLLICSHIIPWAISEKDRLNPSNAICFCALHDRLFERGYFTLNKEMKVIIANKADEVIADLLGESEFTVPESQHPKNEFLEFHRQEIFNK